MQKLEVREAKTMAYMVYIAPQAAYRSCSGAILSQTGRACSL